MRKHLLTASMAALVVLAAAGAEAGLGRPEADAAFVSYDASGCVATQVDVLVRGTAAGGGAAASRLDLAVSQLDECRAVELVRAKKRNKLAAGAFHLESDLSAATLKGEVSIFDNVSGKQLTLTIDLAWAAKEEAVAAAVKGVAEGLGEITRVTVPTVRTMRLAGASGTIKIKGGASNFTPAAAVAASLSRTSFGQRLNVGG